MSGPAVLQRARGGCERPGRGGYLHHGEEQRRETRRGGCQEWTVLAFGG